MNALLVFILLLSTTTFAADPKESELNPNPENKAEHSGDQPGPQASPQVSPGAQKTDDAQSKAKDKLVALIGGKNAEADVEQLRKDFGKALKDNDSNPEDLNKAIADLINPLMGGETSGPQRREIIDSIGKMFPNSNIQKGIGAYVKQAESVDMFRDPKVIDTLPPTAGRMAGGLRPIIFQNGTDQTIRIKGWRNRGGDDDNKWTEIRWPDLEGKEPSVLRAARNPPGPFEMELKPGAQIGWTNRRGDRDVGGAVVDKDNNLIEGYTGEFVTLPGTFEKGMIFVKKKP